MKIGTITTPNAKGQIVIPKKIRESLGIQGGTAINIVMKDGGIYLYPVKEVVGETEAESAYLRILEKTAGAWSGDNWPETEKKRRKIELEASRKMKKPW